MRSVLSRGHYNMKHPVKNSWNTHAYVEIRRLNTPKAEVFPSTVAIKKYLSLTFRSGARLYTILVEKNLFPRL